MLLPIKKEAFARRLSNYRPSCSENDLAGSSIVAPAANAILKVYAMGQEPWLNYIMSIKYSDESQPIVQSNMLVKQCGERGIHAERLLGEKEMFLETAAEKEAALAIQSFLPLIFFLVCWAVFRRIHERFRLMPAVPCRTGCSQC